MASWEVWINGAYQEIDASATVTDLKERFDIDANGQAYVWTGNGFYRLADTDHVIVPHRSWLLFAPSDNDWIQVLQQHTDGEIRIELSKSEESEEWQPRPRPDREAPMAAYFWPDLRPDQ